MKYWCMISGIIAHDKFHQAFPHVSTSDKRTCMRGLALSPASNFWSLTVCKTESNYRNSKWWKPGNLRWCPNVRLRFHVQCIYNRCLFFQLEQLHIMGVTDDATCLHALEATEGDLQAALELLMGTGNPWMIDNHYFSCIVLVSALHVQRVTKLNMVEMHPWYSHDIWIW